MWASVVMYGLSDLLACGSFPDQGLNPCLLHWHTEPLGKPWYGYFCFVVVFFSVLFYLFIGHAACGILVP